MFSLERETDIERLRQAALLLERENIKLIEKITELTRELLSARGEDRAQLELKLQALQQELHVKNKMLFSPSTERSPKKKAREGGEKKPQTGHGPKAQPSLPIRIEEHKLDAPDHKCPKCDGQLAEWKDQFEESEEIDVLERQFVLRKHRRQKYRCNCGHFETALAPTKLFDGARYSINFAIAVVVAKFLDHMPLERQARAMLRDGLDVDSQTLWDQTERLARLLMPVLARLHDYALSNGVVGADETTWWKMRGRNEGPGPSEKWWLWTVVCPRAVFYRMDPERSAEAAAKLLKDYAGIIMCDGYSSYPSHADTLKNVMLVHCWAHVRREFVESRHLAPDEVDKVLEWINQMFAIEREADAGSQEQRLDLRKTRSKELLDKIRVWAMTVRALPESALGKAVKYMTKRWTQLTRFVEDARIPLHNNASERALRGPVVGRKNFRGCRSKRGMEVAALFYSLLESAKLCGLDPREYLRQAVDAALDERTIPLPHELLTPAA